MFKHGLICGVFAAATMVCDGASGMDVSKDAVEGLTQALLAVAPVS
jgi:hypothetical protein